ncbi:MAG TPA: tetratricopeptide repeat protein [Flavitalea sp.]|nr:tetratricopeptide repeat protein [Flavitalea sp.]
MKTLLFSSCLAVISLCANAQKSVRIYNRGVEFASQGNYEKALINFTRAIAEDRLLTEAWFNRALA